MYASHHGEEYEGNDSPFSSGMNFGAPTFGYPGIDSDADIILRTSDKPDLSMVPDYIIRGNDHIKAPQMHGMADPFKHHLHNKFHK